MKRVEKMPDKTDHLREELMFHVLRLIEEGMVFDELMAVGYSSEIASLIFRLREYVLESKKRREEKNG